MDHFTLVVVEDLVVLVVASVVVLVAEATSVSEQTVLLMDLDLEQAADYLVVVSAAEHLAEAEGLGGGQIGGVTEQILKARIGLAAGGISRTPGNRKITYAVEPRAVEITQ